MKKLMILFALLLSFSVVLGACDFPYKERIDSCSPADGVTDGVVTYVRATHNSYWYGGYFYCYPFEFRVPKVPYVAVQLKYIKGAPIRLYLNDVAIADISGDGYWIINLATCEATTCKISSGCIQSVDTVYKIEGVYILDERFVGDYLQSAYYNYLDFRESNDPYMVTGFSGMVTDVDVAYSNGIATYSAVATSYPFNGTFVLSTSFREIVDSIFFFNPATIYGGYTSWVRISDYGYSDYLSIHYTDPVNPSLLRIARYINYSLDKEVILSSTLRKFNAFWIDRKRNLAGVGDAEWINANLFGIRGYMKIDVSYFPEKIYVYEKSIYALNSMATYYQTFLFKYDIPRLAIDVYLPEQFYNVKATSYTLTSVTRTVAYIGERLSGFNETIHSFGVKAPINLDLRRAFIYSPQLGVLANATIVDGIALFDRAVTMNPLYDYYIFIEWNANTYPVFDSNDYKDATKFVYCYSLTECYETTYDLPILINEVLPTGTYAMVKGRIYGGSPPFHVCVNGTIDAEPFSYCIDTSNRDVDLLGLQPDVPRTLRLRANVTDAYNVFAESDEFILRYAKPVLALQDVIVNFEGKDYHYNQYIEINTTSEELLSGKQFVFWVRDVVGGEPPYYSTLICGRYNTTKAVPGTITLGIETTGDISLSYEEFNAMSVDHPLYENATHYARFAQCTFTTVSGAYALTGPIVNIYNFIPKVPITPINITLTLDKTTASVNELVKALISVQGGTPPYKVKLYELIYKYDICEWVTYNGTTQIDLYFSYPCAYSKCERTYYLIASVTDSLGAGATSSIKSLIVNATYNTTLPETIYNPNCPGVVGANITPSLPEVPVVPPVVFPPYAEGVFRLTDIATQLNITGPALVGIMIVDRILSLAGIATILTVLFAIAVGYFTKSGLASAVTVLLCVLMFTILGFYPWWLGVVFIIIAGFIIATMLKGVF